jgi:Xaa-Pro aminopeptidase
MDRRDVFSMLAAGGTLLGAGALRSREAQANWGMIAPGPIPDDDFDGRMLVNRARAFEVMDRERLDGIVALNPVNVFYLGNYVSYEQQKLRAVPSFAVMARDEKQPIFLVAAASDLPLLAGAHREHPEVVPYSMPRDLEKYLEQGRWDVAPEAAPVVSDEPVPATLNAAERHALQFSSKANERRAATPEWALVRALELAGLARGRIAVDDARIEAILKSLGRAAPTCVPGDNTFRKIRLIKSEVELKHMRTIARINQDACMAMLKQVRRGTTKEQIDATFLAEAAKRGAKAVWIAAGWTSGLRAGKVVEGEPMLFDAVSQRNFYHGDFGRTVVLGEPSRELQACMKAIQAGWETVLASVKPGLRYSQLRQLCRDAMKKAYTGSSGIRFAAGPHSVGLQHTDQPYRDGLPFVVPDDLRFEENMTLTVDLPTQLAGWGALHCEDLVVVTRNGVEPLATADGPLVVLA